MGSFGAEIGSKEGRKAEMSEFYELVASPGVFMAGRFGPDGRVAEHKPTRETQGLLGQAVLGPAMSKVVVYGSRRRSLTIRH